MVNAKAGKLWRQTTGTKTKTKTKKTKTKTKAKTKTNDECPGRADFRDQLLGQLDDEDKEDEEYDEDDVE